MGKSRAQLRSVLLHLKERVHWDILCLQEIGSESQDYVDVIDDCCVCIAKAAPHSRSVGVVVRGPLISAVCGIRSRQRVLSIDLNFSVFGFDHKMVIGSFHLPSMIGHSDDEWDSWLSVLGEQMNYRGRRWCR